jgi:ribonuclease HI
MYKTEKLAKQVSASYKDAVIKRFQAPEDIPEAHKYCDDNLITVNPNLWQSLKDRVKADEASGMKTADPAEEVGTDAGPVLPEQPAEAVVVGEAGDEKKPSALPVVRKNTVPAKQHRATQMQLPQWATTVIFTDGSVLPMPGGDDKERMVGGYAALLVFRSMNETEVMISGYKEYPREPAYMEMVAIYKALKRLNKYKTGGKIVLFSDCMEVVTAFNSKLTGWHECGYKLKNGGHVKYWKLWKKIWKVSHKLPLQVQWIKGHAKNGWNIRCDKTAKAEAKLRVG